MGVAGVVATVIIFAILFTVGTGYFIFVNATNASVAQSLIASTNRLQARTGESLDLTTVLMSNGDLGFFANDTAGTNVNMTQAYVFSSAGLLLKCDGIGLPSSQGCGNTTPALWVLVTAGKGSAILDTGYLYVASTTDNLKVITARGNVYSQSYPENPANSANIALASQSLIVNLNSFRWHALNAEPTAIVQKGFNGNCNSSQCTLAYGSSITVADILVYALGWFGQSPPSTPTDTRGDSFALSASNSATYTYTPSLVQHRYTSNCNSASCGLAYSSNVASGNTLAFGLGWTNQSPPSSPTDTRGDSFTLGASQSVTYTPPSPALIQSGYSSNCSSSSCGLAYSSNVAAGDQLVYGLGWENQSPPSTPTDTLGNSFTLGASNSVTAPLTPSLVQSRYLANCNSATCALAYSSSVTAGNTLVYGLGWYGTNPYVPITLTNNQGSATPTTFQQKVTWNPSSYSTYEASDLGNVRFCADSACATTLDAWLESCTPSCATSATSASAWVKLTSAIGASGGTKTIYMEFLATSTTFDGNFWGEAPNIPATYGTNDNGANVFTAYFNGNTATSSFSVYSGYTLAKATGVSGPGGATINAIKGTGYNGNNPVFSFSTAMSNVAMVAESSFSSPGSVAPGTDTGAVGLVNNAAASSVNNGISANMGYNAAYFDQDYESGGAVTTDQNQQGAATSNWVYATLTYTGSGASSWSAYIAPQLYSATGGYSGTVSNNPLSSATNLYLGQISGTTSSYPITIYYNYDRARAYPPSNVMPATSFGGLTTGVASPTSVTDTLGDSFTQGVTNNVTPSGTTTYYSSIWYATAASTSANTITATFSASVPGSVSIYELKSVTVVGPLSSTGSSSAGSTSLTVTSFSPSSNSVVIGNAETASSTSSFTAGTGYTLISAPSCTSVSGCSEYQTGVGSATTAPISIGVSATWVEAAMSFAPASNVLYSYVWSATTASAGADTISASFGSSVAGSVSIYELSGYSTTGTQSSTGSSSAGSNSLSVGSFTPTSNSFVVGNGETGSASAAFTAGTGYALVSTCSGVLGCSEYQSGVGSATTVPLALGASTPWVESAMSFPPAVAMTYYSYMWYATAASSGADTISASFGSSVAGSVSIYELSNVEATGLLSSTGSSSAPQGATSVSSITPITNSIVLGNAEAGSTTYTAGGSYTLNAACSSVNGCSEYQTGVGSATTVPMSISPSSAWAEVALSFQPLQTTYYSYIWTATAVSSGADTITATFGSAVTGTESAYELSGYTTSNMLSSVGSSVAGSTSAAVASFTASGSSPIVIGNVETAASSTKYTVGGGFTSVKTGSGGCDASDAAQGCDEYQANLASSTTVPFTLSASATWVEAAIGLSTLINPQNGQQVGGYPTLAVPENVKLEWSEVFTNEDPLHRSVTVYPTSVLTVGTDMDENFENTVFFIVQGVNVDGTGLAAYNSTQDYVVLPYNTPVTMYFGSMTPLATTTDLLDELAGFQATFEITGQFSDHTLFGTTIHYPTGYVTTANANSAPTAGTTGATVTVSCSSPCGFRANGKAIVGWINSAGVITTVKTFTLDGSGNIPSGTTFQVPSVASGYYTLVVTDYVNSAFMTFQHT